MSNTAFAKPTPHKSGLTFAVLGLIVIIGGFYLYKKLGSKNKANTSPYGGMNSGLPTGETVLVNNQTPSNQGANSQNSGSTVPLAAPQYISPNVSYPNPGWRQYRVHLHSGNLNIRSAPTTSSRIIGSLNNGQTIYARPSQNGWYEYSKNGTDLTGYVYGTYLRSL